MLVCTECTPLPTKTNLSMEGDIQKKIVICAPTAKTEFCNHVEAQGEREGSRKTAGTVDVTVERGID